MTHGWWTAALALCLAGCGGGGGFRPPVESDVVEVATFSAAKVVVGQPIFVFGQVNQGREDPAGYTLARPGKPAVGASFFLPDTLNHRVLGFFQTPFLSNVEANFVLGQPGLAFAIPGLGPTALLRPWGAAAEGTRLLVSDGGNHRVLLWDPQPHSNAAPALVALGQPDLVSGLPGAGAAGLRDPAGVALAGGRLVVADRGNHRVLVYLALPAASGAQADLVLGQADFDTTAPNRGGPPAADTLCDPCGVWTDGRVLVVADRGNHRVLLWTSFPTQHGQPADLVLGQEDAQAAVPRAGPFGLTRPSDVASNGRQLFVADAGNHRVLIWNVLPLGVPVPPDGVLGQATFENVAPNDADQDGLEDPAPSAHTLRSEDDTLTVCVDGPRLFVGDAGNHRLLLFRGP